MIIIIIFLCNPYKICKICLKIKKIGVVGIKITGKMGCRLSF